MIKNRDIKVITEMQFEVKNMKKEILAITVLTILTLVIAGCIGQTFVCPDGTTVDDAALCNAEEKVSDDKITGLVTEINEDLKNEFDIPKLSVELKTMINKGVSRLNSYSYDDKNHPTLGSITVNVKGDKVRYDRKKNDYSLKVGEGRYNKILFEISTKTATGYCDDKDYCTKADMTKTVSLNYNTLLEMPHNILNKMEYAEMGDEVRCYNIPCTKITFIDEEGKKSKLWIENYYSIPLKKTNFDETKVEFKLVNFVANELSDSDMELPVEVVN